MRWKVEGADAATGNEIRITVEAFTREEAETKARYNGILVASVSPLVPEPAPPLAYESKPVQPALVDPMATPDDEDLESAELQELAAVARSIAPPQPIDYRTPGMNPPAIPEYQDIVTGAQWLNVLSMFVAVVGWFCIAGGCVFFVINVIQDGGIVLSMFSAVTAVGVGGGLIVVAALVRTCSSLAMAVRDIARNSHLSRSE
jgi:hypothetical protein